MVINGTLCFLHRSVYTQWFINYFHFFLFILPRTIRHRTANNLCSCHTVVQQPVTVQLNTMSETQLAASSRKQNWLSTAHLCPAVPKHSVRASRCCIRRSIAYFAMICMSPLTVLHDPHIKGQNPNNAYNTVHKSHTAFLFVTIVHRIREGNGFKSGSGDWLHGRKFYVIFLSLFKLQYDIECYSRTPSPSAYPINTHKSSQCRMHTAAGRLKALSSKWPTNPLDTTASDQPTLIPLYTSNNIRMCANIWTAEWLQFM